MPRRKREDTRALLLEAGARLVLDRFRTAAAGDWTGAPLESVSSTQVCGAAGVSTGSLYQLWDTQRDYRRDLLFHLLESANSDALETSELAGKGAAASQTPEDAVREVGKLVWQRLRDRDTYFIFLATFGLIRDPDVADAIRRAYQEADDANVPLYEALLAFFGLRMRSPLEVDDLAVALGALLDGFSIRWQVDPEATRPDLAWDASDTDAEWSLFTVSAAGLVRALTEPDDDGQHQTAGLLPPS